MAPVPPRLRILSVGGNAVSAFLSWRLQATNACDVTLVWKAGFENVSQYGISFKSKLLGNERFKPRQVVRTPEEASQSSKTPFDYVLLCVKALPDVYDISAIIESVVSPQHTCILVNTTHSLGVESYLEQRFPTNVVLSLVSGAEVIQTGPSEFEHREATGIFVGAANKNSTIPTSIQSDMSEALAMTLHSGQVECTVSQNIYQQQYERMIGPIAFHPASVIFEIGSHAELLEKVGVRSLVSDTIDELVRVATAQGCSFPTNFKEQTIEEMTRSSETQSIMYQDYLSRRPMEVEIFLGSPMKFAQENSVSIPRIETLYALLHHLNTMNQTRPPPGTPQAQQPQGRGPPPRMSSVPVGAIMGNGPMKGPMPGPMRAGSRNPSMTGPPPPPPPPGMMRRGPPPPGVNGFQSRAPSSTGHHPPAGPGMPMKGPSFEGNDLEEFSHLMLYEDIPEDGLAENTNVNGVYGDPNMQTSTADIAMRERELALRQREIAIREQEYNMRRSGPRRPQQPPPGAYPVGGAGSTAGFDDDDDDDDGYFDPSSSRGHAPMIDPDNFDMMSVTSRRTRKAPSASAIRRNPDMNGPAPQSRRTLLGRPGVKQRRTSARMMTDVPGLHGSLMDNPLMAYSSNRYGNVDRQAMGADSRTNSLTSARLDELQQGGIGGAGGYGAYPSMNRRVSGSPGHALAPPMRNGGGGRPSPPNGLAGSGNPPHQNGNRKPSPPSAMRQPVPRHPPGHGNSVAPQQVEQRVGVSHLYPPKPRAQVRSLTGSASASAESGESGASAQLDSENSAHSSQSSLGPRPAIGVR